MKRFISTIVLLGVCVLPSSAQSVIDSPRAERSPQVAEDGSGNRLLVFRTGSQNVRLMGQWLSSSPSDTFLIAHSADEPSVTVLSDGRFIVAYSVETPDSLLDVEAAVLSFPATSVDERIALDAIRSETQAAPDVAAHPDGGFRAVWHAWDRDDGDRAILYRGFDTSLSPTAAPVVLNQRTRYSQAYPQISIGSSGLECVVWMQWDVVASRFWSYDIVGASRPLGGSWSGDIVLHDRRTTHQLLPDVATDDTYCLGTWSSWGQDGDESGIIGRLFTTDGPQSDEIVINTTTDGYQWNSRVAFAPPNAWIVSWSGYTSAEAREDLYVRVLPKFLNGSAPEIPLTPSEPGFQFEPSIVVSGSSVDIYYTSDEGTDDVGRVMHTRLTEVATYAEVLPDQDHLLRGPIYPNPATSAVTLPLVHASRPIEVTLYDALGRALDRRVLAVPTHQFSYDRPSDLPSGVYWLVVSDGNLRETHSLIIP